ncbi:retrovirus-related pol polyprotein from transposon TNT 1-94 [Tanacetum coccineum]
MDGIPPICDDKGSLNQGLGYGHRSLSSLELWFISNHLERHGLAKVQRKTTLTNPNLKIPIGKLYSLHMDSMWAIRVASVNGKKYILVIVEITLDLLGPCIRTDNGTEFVNQALREYYEKVGISHETSVARSPQQNGVVERRNRTSAKSSFLQHPLYPPSDMTGICSFQPVFDESLMLIYSTRSHCSILIAVATEHMLCLDRPVYTRLHLLDKTYSDTLMLSHIAEFDVLEVKLDELGVDYSHGWRSPNCDEDKEGKLVDLSHYVLTALADADMLVVKIHPYKYHLWQLNFG